MMRLHAYAWGQASPGANAQKSGVPHMSGDEPGELTEMPFLFPATAGIFVPWVLTEVRLCNLIRVN